jgi:L-asparaginase
LPLIGKNAAEIRKGSIVKLTDRRYSYTVHSIIALSAMVSGDGIAADLALPVCHMIATGGTIAMKIDPVKGAPVPALSGEDLLTSVPGLGKVATVQVENLFNIPSDHRDPEHWVAIRKNASGFARRQSGGLLPLRKSTVA